jgi:uncharacterized iron-regulated protein
MKRTVKIQNLMVGCTHTHTHTHSLSLSLSLTDVQERGVISLLLFAQRKERRVTKSYIKMGKEICLSCPEEGH